VTTEEQVRIFGEVLWDRLDRIEVRAIHPDRERFSTKRLWLRAEELPSRLADLQSLNERGYGVFVGVCPRLRDGGKAEDVALCRVLWGDLDGVFPNEALAKVAEVGLPAPTLTVNSGHGTHVYWRTTDLVPLERVEGLAKRLAAAIGGDPQVTDLPRVMRLPGFTNHKDPAAPCEIFDTEHIETRYDLAAFESVLPPLPAPVDSGTRGPEVTQGRDAALRQALKYLITQPGTSEGNRNNVAFRVAAALTRGFKLAYDDAWPMLQSWNRLNQDPLPEGELRSCLESGCRNGEEAVGGRLVPAGATPRIWAVSAFLAQEFDPERWLVEGIWAIEGCGFIAGPPKSRKSILAHDLALALVTRGQFLGHDVPEARRVLLIDIENRAADLQLRLFGLMKGRHLTVGDLAHDRLMVWSQPSLRLDTDEGIATLEALIVKHESEVVIIDPLVRCHALDENSASEMARILTPLRRLQAQHHCAFVIVHHSSRAAGFKRMADLLRGTGDFHGWLDSGIGVEPLDGRCRLHFAQRSGPELEPFEIEVRFEGQRIDIILPGPDEPLAADRRLDALVLEFIRGSGHGCTKNQIAKGIRRNNEHVSASLARLERQQRICGAHGRGAHGPKTTRYSIAPETPTSRESGSPTANSTWQPRLDPDFEDDGHDLPL
jgi:hypothetical protein